MNGMEAWPSGVRCRCCYGEIFSGSKFRRPYDLDGRTEVFADILQQTFSLSLRELESEYVCTECAGRLCDARDFRTLVLQTEKKLVETVLKKDETAEVKRSIKTEVEDVERNEENWDVDYLDTDDYIDDSPPVKEEAQDSKDGVFRTADTMLKDILSKRDDNRVVPRARTPVRAKRPDNIKVTVRRAGKKMLSLGPKMSIKNVLRGESSSGALMSGLLNSTTRSERQQMSVDSLLKVLASKPRVKVIAPVKEEPDIVSATTNGMPVHTSAERRIERQIVKRNIILLLKHTNMVPFIHYRSLYKCIFCGQAFVTFDQLKIHDNSEHSKRRNWLKKIHTYRDILHIEITGLKCTKCDVSFSDICACKAHLLSEHKVKLNMHHKDDVMEFKLLGVEGFSCHLCSREFHVFRNLSLHMNEHFPNYMCDCCGKPFISYIRCLNHESSHKTGTYPCKKCDKVFNTANARNCHYLEHRDSKYRCPQCAQSFQRYIDRTYHMSEVHNITQRFVCTHPDCSKEFIHKPSFDAHMKSHQQKEKKVECNVCGMRFINNYCLGRHMISHTGERSFQCKVCGKKYGRRNTLREHMKIHDNVRRHVCSECGQAFVQKCSLKGHMKSRHPHVPFA